MKGQCHVVSWCDDIMEERNAIITRAKFWYIINHSWKLWGFWRLSTKRKKESLKAAVYYIKLIAFSKPTYSEVLKLLRCQIFHLKAIHETTLSRPWNYFVDDGHGDSICYSFQQILSFILFRSLICLSTTLQSTWLVHSKVTFLLTTSTKFAIGRKQHDKKYLLNFELFIFICCARGIFKYKFKY